MASSRPIVAGEDYTPDDINNLRSDVLDPVGGHKHNGTDGAKIPFSNLDVADTSGSTPPAGGSKSYNDIANHVGSSQDVHGLGTLGYVLGSMSQSLVVQTGTITGFDGHVTFPHAFTSTPIVFLSLKTAAGYSGNDWPKDAGTGYRNVTSTGFDIKGDEGANQAILATSWMAIGVLA